MLLYVSVCCSCRIFHCMIVGQFIHSPVSGHLSFLLWGCDKSAINNFVHKHSFLLGMCLGVELLGHETALRLALEDTTKHFKIMEINEKLLENFSRFPFSLKWDFISLLSLCPSGGCVYLIVFIFKKNL